MADKAENLTTLINRLRELESNVEADGYWVEDEAAVVMDALPTLLLALEKATKTLESIASYNEGKEVTSTFDCPRHATEARQALESIESICNENKH